MKRKKELGIAKNAERSFCQRRYLILFGMDHLPIQVLGDALTKKFPIALDVKRYLILRENPLHQKEAITTHDIIKELKLKKIKTGKVYANKPPVLLWFFSKSFS